MKIPSLVLCIRHALYEESPETLISITHQPATADTASSVGIGDIAGDFDHKTIGAMHREQWITERERSNGRDYLGFENDPRDPVLDDAYFAAYPSMRDVLA
jgi:hypothetical protein